MTLTDMRPSEAQVQRYTQAGYWSDELIGDLLERNAAAFPARDAVIDVRQRLTYATYYRRAQRLAARWLRLGLTKQDVIAIQLPNWSEFAVAVGAASLAGIPFCHFHSDFRRKEVEFILRFTGASLLVTPSRFRGFDHMAMVREVRRELPRLAQIDVVGDDVPADGFDLRRFLETDTAPELPEAELPKPDMPKPDMPKPDMPKPDMPEAELPELGCPSRGCPSPGYPRRSCAAIGRTATMCCGCCSPRAPRAIPRRWSTPITPACRRAGSTCATMRSVPTARSCCSFRSG